MMKIIICGSGPVAVGIARQLAAEGNDVTVIDDDAAAIAKINESLDVTAVVGFPSHPTVMERVGAANAEMIIAVTPSDEINMVACQVAHSIFSTPIKIARIRHKNYLLPIWNDMYRQEHLPVDYIISPESEVAKAIINRLHVPGAMDSISMAGNKVQVIELRIAEDCPLVKQPFGRIEELCAHLQMAILTVIRDQKMIAYDTREKLMAGDELFFVTGTEHVEAILSFFGIDEKEARRILIVGGGNIGYFIAQELAKDPQLNTKIIELNQQRAEYVAERVPEVTVICGSALEQEILSEASVENTETVIAVTNDDEVNILTSLLAKRSGAKRCFTLVNKGRSYSPLMGSLGIDVMVNPREMTVSSIIQHTRRGKILSAHSILSGAAEIIEIEALEDALITGQKVSELALPKGIRLGAIVRDETVLIPQADTQVKRGDHLIILSPTEDVQKVDAIFSARQEYF